MLGGDSLKRKRQAKAPAAPTGVPREVALGKLDQAGHKLLRATELIEEAAGQRQPKGEDKRHDELELLGEEARDVYVRLRTAHDTLEASSVAAVGS